MLPRTNHSLPFAITRASHVELTVTELDASVRFYSEVFGLTVSDLEPGVAYLRGLEEAAHHSLVLRADGGPPRCVRLGFRVAADDDLGPLGEHLRRQGCPVTWADPAHQGRTLRSADPAGVPLEFCASMDVEPRLITSFHRHRGGRAQRLDHFQLLTPAVDRGCGFYAGLGFRVSEYLATAEDELVAAFLQRKGNPHDVVLFRGDGPRFHHVAFTTVDATTLIHACDVAGELGYGARVERGPGRHGPGHALFVYMRDPDGHRIELFTSHYQMLDAELEPTRWDVTDPAFGTPWGLPAQRSWHEDASAFPGLPPQVVKRRSPLPTLERYLAELSD